MKRRMIGRAAAGALLAVWLGACAHGVDEATAPSLETVYESALTRDGRFEGDAEKDASRKPVETLAFMGIEPGDTVLEMEAGGGYFTEILSAVVGADGEVYMQNPAAFDGFLGDSVSKRVDGRLENVTYLKVDFDDLMLADDSVDHVTWFQGPHELWFSPAEGVSLGDPSKSFKEIYRVLKPGGVLTVIDHAAPRGSGPETGGDTHRIDPQIVDKFARAAGLKMVKEGDFLANADDDMLTNVFDPAIRGQTNQFVVQYRKPE